MRIADLKPTSCLFQIRNPQSEVRNQLEPTPKDRVELKAIQIECLEDSVMPHDASHSSGPRKGLVNFFIVLFVLTLGIGIGTVISYQTGAVGPGDSQLKIQSDSKPLAGPSALALSQAFEDVANRVEPAVVNINTEEVVKVTKKRGAQKESPREDPFDWFHQFFNGPEE